MLSKKIVFINFWLHHLFTFVFLEKIEKIYISCVKITFLCKFIKQIFIIKLFKKFSVDTGDEQLFHTLEKNLIKSIPTDSVDWRRSYDRPIKPVRLSANFTPFSQDVLPSGKDCHLVKRPIFHTYWSECSVIILISLLISLF